MISGATVVRVLVVGVVVGAVGGPLVARAAGGRRQRRIVLAVALTLVLAVGGTALVAGAAPWSMPAPGAAPPAPPPAPPPPDAAPPSPPTPTAPTFPTFPTWPTVSTWQPSSAGPMAPVVPGSGAIPPCAPFQSYSEAAAAAHVWAAAPPAEQPDGQRRYAAALQRLRAAFPSLADEIDTWDRVEQHWVAQVQTQGERTLPGDETAFAEPDFDEAVHQLEAALDQSCAAAR